MLYLQLPPSEGALANDLKEAILARMYDQREGLLHACEALKVSKARALAELKADAEFSAAVDQARLMLAEWYHEEAVKKADQATGRDDTPAAALQYKARMEFAEQLLVRLRPATNKGNAGNGNHLHLHEGATVFISEAKREQLQAQRERILATSRPKVVPNERSLGPNECSLPNECLTSASTEARGEEGEGVGAPAQATRSL